MRKFKLYAVISGEREDKPIIANGFVDAEKKAKEMYVKIYPDYPCDDTYIECVESDFDLNYDHLILQKDCFGDVYWRTIVYGDWGPLYTNLLDDEDKRQLKEWREEIDYHVTDLDDDELRYLYSQVTFGSIYLSDYSNDWFIDEKEVSDICEQYDYWVFDEKQEDTPDNFVYYINNVY